MGIGSGSGGPAGSVGSAWARPSSAARSRGARAVVRGWTGDARSRSAGGRRRHRRPARPSPSSDHRRQGTGGAARARAIGRVVRRRHTAGGRGRPPSPATPATRPTARALLADPDPACGPRPSAPSARMAAATAADVAAALADPSPEVRRRACRGGGRPSPRVDLRPLLADPDAVVVEAAAWALGERARRPPATWSRRLSAVATDHDDPLCREAAVAALGAIGDDRRPARHPGRHPRPARHPPAGGDRPRPLRRPRGRRRPGTRP